MFKVIISGSRDAEERKIVKGIFENSFGNCCCSLYDCNGTITDVTIQGKQIEINDRVKNCDWYIFLATSENYGEYTAYEWETLVKYLGEKPHDKIITILKCKNPKESVESQKFNDNGSVSFGDLEKIMKYKQYFLEYSYITQNNTNPFSDLENVINNEINRAKTNNIFLRVLSKSVQDITAEDVFANKYRTEPDNGFDDDVYCKRKSVDDELDVNSGFIVITGAPASGKTRAMYERLKRRKGENKEARVIVVDDYNFNQILVNLEGYSRHIDDYPMRPDNLSEYIFIFDQITDIVYDAKTKSDFNEFYKYASKLNMLILATSLTSSFDNLKDNEFVPNGKCNVINIGNIRETKDSAFNEELSETYKVDCNKINVIGECIKGLKDYNDTITKAINEYSDNEAIEAFVKAFNVINLFRKGNLWPLGLVLAVAKKINSRLDAEKIESVMTFFKNNNILHCQNMKEKLTRGRACPDLKEGISFQYDGEKLKIMVSADWIIKIDNDYTWQYLCTEKYLLDWKNENDLNDSMKWYYDAFFEDSPFLTLRRIISRSPAVKLAQKGVDTNFVQTFVTEKINEINIDEEVHKNELYELMAYVLHRSSDLETFKETYEEFVGRGFELNELTVAEIMGFAQYKSKVEQNDLKKFIEEKGWKFEYKVECNSIYYNRRLIQYMDEFEKVKELMEKYKIPDDTSSDNKLFDQQNKRHLISNIIEKCKNVENVRDALEKARQMNVSLDRFFFLTLEKTIKNTRFSYDANQLLGCLCDYFIPTADAAEQKPLSEMSKGVVLYYILSLSDSFCSASQIYKQCKAVLNEEPELDARCISVMLSRTKKTELCYIYNFFFSNDGKLVGKLPQISRNLLLEKLDFNSAMTAFEFLFDSSDYDSTPDIYTVISLLKANLEYGKSARYKDYTRNTDHVKYIYQNLLQILSHKKLSGVKRLDRALSLIIQCCNSENQEKYVMDKYVKPSCKEEIKEVDDYFKKLNNKPEIVISQIKRDDFTDTEKILDKVISVMDGLSESGLVEEDLINCCFAKLYKLCVNGKIDDKKYKECRDRMSKYLDTSFNEKKNIDCIIKGEYFYQAYYKAYPEKIIVQKDDKYVFNENVLNSMPPEYISTELYEKIMSGVKLIYNEDKNVCDDLFEWLKNNNINIISVCSNNNAIKKEDSKQNNEPTNKFDLDEINKIKSTNKNYVPDYNSLHRYLKNNNRNINPIDILKLLESVFLAYGLPITSTLWKSALIGIKRSLDENTSIKIDELYKNYKNLIFNDMTTKIYHLNIYSGERRKEWFGSEVEPFIENCQLTQMDYCELIRQYDLYESDMDGYFNLIKGYIELSTIMGDENVQYVYNNFVKGYEKNKGKWQLSDELTNLVNKIKEKIIHHS
ncbi:MAG: hypothetical protein IKW51_06330 [Bacteroidales bacterium]|nr:hypothetical protein [Bacteroidales bacterium]